MKNLLIGSLIFVGGFGAGVLASKAYFKNKYASIAEEEIESIRETYKKKEEVVESKKSELEELVEKVIKEDEKAIKRTGKVLDPELSDKAKQIIEENGYFQEEQEMPEKTTSIKKTVKRPSRKKDESYARVISPEEFGENENYETIDLTYYADGVLADDQDEVVDDPEDLVGPEALRSFGEYQEDVVHVCSERRKCYYEITTDPRNYRDIYR